MAQEASSRELPFDAPGKMDSARSWLVAGACCWINVFSCAMVVSSGIVYVNILQTLDVTREQASWPVSLMTNVYMVAGLVASVASRHFSIRSLFLAACLLGSLAIGACYFASKIWHFVVFFGIMYGTSLGFLRLTSVAVNQHFHSYKAAASGINVAGFSIAGLIFPPLAQLIFDTYGFRGAFLISSSDPLLIFMARPKFYLVTLTHLAAFANMTTYISVVVDFAEDRGIAKWDAISIISSFTVTDLVARLCSGWITDRKHVSRSTWVSFNFGLWALTLVLMPACSSHPGQMVFAAVYGWTTGCVLTLVPVLYAEVANLDQFAVCFGTGSCIVGAITMLRPVIIGFFRDTQGDYEGLFYLLGGFTGTMSVLWGCVTLRASRRTPSAPTV
ncbi:uncharacterized protein ISCGN_027793 [Ixodes scapularis]